MNVTESGKTQTNQASVADAFRSLLDGMTVAHDLAETLRENSPQQTTQGSFYVPENFKSLVQLQ